MNNMSEIENIVRGPINNIGNTNELNYYNDKYTTKEQQKRDKFISELLEQYLLFYTNKVKENRMYKKILYWICILSVILFTITLCTIVFLFFLKSKFDIVAATQLISACVTFLSLIFGILTIITKYVFPKGDEDYITRIVELIQKNDLQNKKENIKINNNGSN